MLGELAGASVDLLSDLDALIVCQVGVGGEEIVLTAGAHVLLARQNLQFISSLVPRPVVIRLIEQLLSLDLEHAVLCGSINWAAMGLVSREHTIVAGPSRRLLLHRLVMGRFAIV